MALENQKSQLGPTNKIGQPGTGELRDTLAFEGMVVLVRPAALP